MARFPLIHNIDQILPHVEGREEFIVGEREGFTFIDYAVTMPGTFQDPEEKGIDVEEYIARRMRLECRGIKFYPDGRLAARPYHKFFNIGEKEWTQPHVIPWGDHFIILEKLDGSMIHPLWLDGNLYFCTRMGITDIAEDALGHAWASGSDYLGFCARCERHGWTPLFEWCTADRYKQIVIKHTENHLVLTGIRNKEQGFYMDYLTMKLIADEYNVPVVGQWDGDWDGIDAFLAEVKGLENAEGYVLSFDGEKYKTKGDWYCAIHRAKDAIQFEKDVVELIIDGKLDDVMPSLLEDDRERLERFQHDFWAGVVANSDEVNAIIDKIQQECPHDEIGPRKRWIADRIKFVFKEPNRALAFAIVNEKPVVPHVKKALKLRVGSGPRLESMRPLFGVNWLDY